ncbi:MAG: GGDEF domain-containing protein [Terracidiphilus sp.]
MADLMELLEAALDGLPEGMGIFDGEGMVMFWNQAAQGITGYTNFELLGHAIPEDLAPLLAARSAMERSQPLGVLEENHRSMTRARHKMGHMVSILARVQVLSNELGERLGTALLFHPLESLDALPRSELGDAAFAEDLRTDLLEQLQIECDDFARGGAPIGILSVRVDQARELCKTHGAPACRAMLEKVYYALAHGLRPGEKIGYWANDGFLVIAHERSEEMLSAHAQRLVGLARTADFRWWGDRISLTASVGAAQAASDPVEPLVQLLRRAREAMENSIREGGNRATIAARGGNPDHAQEDSLCLPL